MYVANVGPEYFAAAGIRLLRGRTFVETDRENAPLVALVNQTFAQRLFPGGDPVGRRFELGRPRPGRPVTAVSASTRRTTPPGSVRRCRW